MDKNPTVAANDPPQATILIVDDDPSNLSALGSLLRPSYKVMAAPSGERALQIATGPNPPDLILLDVMMPKLDGYSVLKMLRGKPEACTIPVIFVTSLDTCEDEEHGLMLGAVDYIAKPYRPPIILARVRTHLELKHARDLLAHQNAYLEAEVASRTRDIHLIQNVTINALAELAETRDPQTGYHIHRTQEYVRLLAKRLQKNPRFSELLTDKVVDLLTKSAPLHDIGKVGIPDQILLKPGKLTGDEWQIMKTHALLGSQAIERAARDAGQSVEFLNIAKQIAHYHHEKWDGNGYPEGLKSEAIPIPARLMAVADVFDALTTRRPYKTALPPQQVRDMIIAESGSHFDPDVVNAFLAGFDDFANVAQRYENHGVLYE
ncbi:MAG: HD domain-containing phosphohydrolase [Gammaproteobacteria bacterium]